MQKYFRNTFLFKIVYTIHVFINVIVIIFFKKNLLIQAFNWKSIDSKSKSIPWYTFSAIDFLDGIDFSDTKVFEFGSGSSSFWWAQRAKSIISVEDDSEWFLKINSKKLKNMKLLLKKNKNSYINAINTFKDQVNLIIVDGKYREDCMEKAIEMAGGYSIVILDNSDRYLGKLDDYALRLNAVRVDFGGLGPINGYEWKTTLFIGRETRFVSKIPS